MITRAGVAIVLSVGAVFGLAYAQWFVLTPGMVSDAEWHLLLLVGGNALIITLSAQWVDNGRRRP
jgi:hypothetical protein